jgi:hypothetical protein
MDGGVVQQGSDRVIVHLGSPRDVFKVWLFIVRSEMTALLSGRDVNITLSFNLDGRLKCLCILGDITCLLFCRSVPLCRWALVSLHLDRNCVTVEVDDARSSRHLHFVPGDVQFDVVTFQGEDAYWSLSKKKPFFPEESAPTPNRFVGPIRSVKELLSTQETKLVIKRSTAAVEGLLVCHDFRGNYLKSDSSLDTVFGANMPHYTFIHWPLTSLFVYFSHHRISFPPPSWVVAARSNLCRILGTVITEWEEGEQDNVRLFEDPERSARALAQLAAERKFDGWLINIEAPVRQGSLFSFASEFWAVFSLKGSGLVVIVCALVSADTSRSGMHCCHV